MMIVKKADCCFLRNDVGKSASLFLLLFIQLVINAPICYCILFHLLLCSFQNFSIITSIFSLFTSVIISSRWLHQNCNNTDLQLVVLTTFTDQSNFHWNSENWKDFEAEGSEENLKNTDIHKYTPGMFREDLFSV